MSKETSAAVAASTSVAGGVVDQVKEAATPLAPFSDTLNVIKYILIGIAVISFGLTVYAIWKGHKTKQAIG